MKRNHLDFVRIKGELFLKIDSVNSLAENVEDIISKSVNIDDETAIGMLMGLIFFREELKHKAQDIMVEYDLKDMGFDSQILTLPENNK